MDVKRLRMGDWLAGAWGIALLGSLWLDWYDAICAWQAFAVTDVLLAVCALGGIATWLLALGNDSPARPVAAAVLTTALSAIAVLVTVYRVAVNEPGPNASVGVDTGAYIGLICILGLFTSTLAAVRDESSPHQAPIEPTELPAPPL